MAIGPLIICEAGSFSGNSGDFLTVNISDPILDSVESGNKGKLQPYDLYSVFVLSITVLFSRPPHPPFLLLSLSVYSPLLGRPGTVESSQSVEW